MPFATGNLASPSRRGNSALTGYQITIRNENSQLQYFSLFQAYLDSTGSAENPLSLIWMTGTVAPGSETNPSLATFLWQDRLSAITGYIQETGTETDPRQIIVFSNQAVESDRDNKLDVTYLGTFPNGAPAFPQPPVDGPASTITFRADGTIPTPVQTASRNVTINVGIGMDAKPTLVLQMEPNKDYAFPLPANFHVVSGPVAEAQPVDPSMMHRAFPIVFPPGATSVTLAYSEQNQFRVV